MQVGVTPPTFLSFFNMKQIEIEEMRISSDGRFLEFRINCPREYHFTDFLVKVRGDNNEYSLNALFEDWNADEDYPEHNYSGQIPIESFGVTEPTIYSINLRAEINDKGDVDDENPEELEISALISDVKEVYDCMIRDIKALDSKCTDDEILNRVIRNYMILYAHQEALHLGNISDAERWFDMMANCFSGRCAGTNSQPGCGCGCKTVKVEPSCGCGK